MEEIFDFFANYYSNTLNEPQLQVFISGLVNNQDTLIRGPQNRGRTLAAIITGLLKMDMEEDDGIIYKKTDNIVSEEKKDDVQSFSKNEGENDETSNEEKKR
uniref:NTF2 domain-containing protein n=1 Tax=Strongyloides papillosus TaxID=174720 RepID=A0A0N5BIH3_STREA